MDFDLSKENIQPLRGGRNVSQLEVALQAQTNQDYQRELQQQREEFEKLIGTYTGNDPLENWYSYVSWVEQSYPKHGHEGNLIPVLEHCFRKFENDKRYANDPRFCKLWIKYIDLRQNPLELYQMMHAKGLCRGCADFYKAWAYYHEAAGDFQKANHVFELGKRELAQPYDELEMAHKNLIMAAGQHMLYGPDERGLVEKRQALTSLHTYKPGRVASVRTVNNPVPGIFPTSSGTLASSARPNAAIPIYEDCGDEAYSTEAAPISILQAAKRQDMPKENTLKPGPWATVPVKKRLAVQRASGPGFVVHEDNDDRPEVRVNFPPHTLEKYDDWVVSLTLPEPKNDKMVPIYPKEKVYSQLNSEISLEEIRASRYRTKRARLQIVANEKSSPPGEPSRTMRVSPVKQSPMCDQRLANTSTSSNPQPSNSMWSHQSGPGGDSNLNPNDSDFAPWNFSSEEVAPMEKPKPPPKFEIYEQSNVGLQERIEPKGLTRGSAMKTPFKDFNAEELAETGSRGGMDVAAAAPIDSAKRLIIFDDDSSPPFDQAEGGGNFDMSCSSTQLFNFNLNAMQVSTPQTKQFHANDSPAAFVNNTRKQLFDGPSSTKKSEVLSTILEETKSYGSSSSSSGTKSAISSSNVKQTNMSTISEEHNSYLAQNLMANAALRSSLLGDLMDFNPPHEIPVQPSNSYTNNVTAVIENVPSPAHVTPLDYIPSDPFKPALINTLLEQVAFPGPHTRGYHLIYNNPKLVMRKDPITLGPDRYIVEKVLGRGTFGTVFRSIDYKTGNTVALKWQKQTNKWEFYICRELQSRLANHPLRDRFMDVKIAYFGTVNAVLASDYKPHGSLLELVNTIKHKSGSNMKESLCIFFCIEMLKIVQAMHDAKIIHADVKPDNFLVQFLSDGSVGLQLIDFGCSIDLTLFPPGASFTRRITTEDFVCCEMIEGRPWNYHTDLFCVAATAHALLFDKYIHIQKKDGLWSITQRLPRYLQLDLWNTFFSKLLNQQSGPADTQQLQHFLNESLKNKSHDFHNDMRYLLNILKNR